MIALNTYEKGRKEDILVHKHELLLFSKLAFPSYSLAELVTKSGFLAQVSGVEGEEEKKKSNPAESPSPLLPVFSRAARHCSPGTWLGCASLPAAARLSSGTEPPRCRAGGLCHHSFAFPFESSRLCQFSSPRPLPGPGAVVGRGHLLRPGGCRDRAPHTVLAPGSGDRPGLKETKGRTRDSERTTTSVS